MDQNLELFREQARAELNRLEAQSSAKDVAGKAIGRHGLAYITAIVLIGVVSSLFLEEQKIAAVMGLLGASLTALISLLSGIASANVKEEKPEFLVMRDLVERLDKMADRDPMSVSVDGDKVLVRKGNNEIQTAR
jgi:hypothetical protein